MRNVVVDVCPMGDDAAFALEYDVYLREGYIEPNPFHRVLENADYPEFVHFVARIGDKTIGSLRLVTDAQPRHGVFKLSSFRHFSVHEWALKLLASTESRQVFEIGTMVIDPEYRGGRIYTILFQKAFEFALLKRIRYSLTTVDEKFFHCLRKRGLPFHAIGEKQFYMGSETVPAMIDVEQLARMVLGGGLPSEAERVSSGPSAPLQPAMAS